MQQERKRFIELFQSPNDLRTNRNLLRLSQTRLAVLADVPRWRIAHYELGASKLGDAEKARIVAAFESELSRLRNFGEPAVALGGGAAA